jgi:hypothetical protein
VTAPVYRRMTIKLTAALLLATSSLAAADAKPEPTDPKLAQLVGRWEGKSDFTVKGNKSTWTMTTSCERTAIGPGILCTSVALSGTMKLEEVWLLGFDFNTQQYHLFMLNSWGEAYDHAATWADAKTVSFVHTGTREGKPLREEYKLTFKGNELRMYGVLTVDGKPVGEGTTISKRVP